MKKVFFEQGSQEWHAHRANCYNASDAAAMLGISPYTKRDDLIKRYATGFQPEFSNSTLAVFERGHELEALARSIVEENELEGEALYPVSGFIEDSRVGKKISSSFDGLTEDDKVTWEHKQNNQLLWASLQRNELPDNHQPQVQQGLMISGAEFCIFTVSDGTRGNMISINVYPDQVWFERIINGWAQFEKDVAEYQRKMKSGELEAIEEKPDGEPIEDLPAIYIAARTGGILSTDIDRAELALKRQIESAEKVLYITDQDFANASVYAKSMRKFAKDAIAAKERMINQPSDDGAVMTLGEMAKKLDYIAELANKHALKIEKDCKANDIAKKEAMTNSAVVEWLDHIAALEVETKPIKIPTPRPDFGAAIKGKRNYASMQDAVNTALAMGKADADAAARDIRAKLAWCKENAAGRSNLFPDLAQIISKPMDDFTLTIKTRITDADAEIEKKRADDLVRIEAEAKAKAESEAKLKLAQEEARIRADEQAKAKAEAEALAKKQKEEADAVVNHAAIAQPTPTAQSQKVSPENAVIEHQKVIAEFLKCRSFGDQEGKIRAVLVEFCKFSESFNAGA